MDAWLAGLEAMDLDGRRASLAYVAGQQVAIPEDELNEALRRAVVVRAVGGSPLRELALDEAAVRRFAEEVDRAERRRALHRALEALRGQLGDRPVAAASLEELLADEELAWRCFAAAYVAAEVAA
jgi:hypothetical protein